MYAIRSYYEQQVPAWEVPSAQSKPEINHKSNVNLTYTFDNFVEGKSRNNFV